MACTLLEPLCIFMQNETVITNMHAGGKKSIRVNKALESESLVLSLGSTASKSVDFVPLSPLGKVWTIEVSYSSVEVMIEYVQFSHSVMSDSLQPHGLQHARPPCPSPAPGVYSKSCPLSR